KHTAFNQDRRGHMTLEATDASPTQNIPGTGVENGAAQPAQAVVSRRLAEAVNVLQRLQQAVKNQVMGRDDVIELVIIALIADGHVLLEDFPGSGKTTLAKALGEAIVTTAEDQADGVDASILPFRRIQFTPDLLPADVTGGSGFDARRSPFPLRLCP